MERSIITQENINQLSRIALDHIPESILYYICYEHQYNLFGYGKLDPEEFAKKFKYAKKYLFNNHVNPYRNIILGKLKDKKDNRTRTNNGNEQMPNCVNRIENALYILTNVPLMRINTLVDDDKKLIRQFMPFRILKSFYMEQDKKTGKITYVYELEESFRRNLSTFYLKSNTDSLVKLRSSGLGPLYQTLLKKKDELFIKGQTETLPDDITFDMLCKLANINTNQELKYQKRNLNIALRKIQNNTELNFKLTWINNGAAEKYTPIFTFIPNEGEITEPDSNLKAYLTRNEKNDIACIEFKHNLLEACPYNRYEYINNAEQLFYSWVAKKDTEHKKSLRFQLTKTFVNIGAYIPDDINERIDYFLESLEKKGNEQFDNIIKEMFFSTRFKTYTYKITSQTNNEE